MSKVFAGARIRTLRKERGLTQVEMAHALGFSTSYLNQLENDHRPLTVTTLMQLTSVFSVPPEYFSGAGAARTAAAMQQVLTTALSRSTDPAVLEDFATRFPDLAQDIILLGRRASSVTAGSVDAADPDGGTTAPALPPVPAHETVRDFFHAHSNYFDELDRAAEALSTELPSSRAGRADGLAKLLRAKYNIRSIRVPVAADDDGALAPRRVFDETTGVLRLRADLTRSQAAFEMAMQLAFLQYGDLLEAALDGSPFPDESARNLAYFGLAQYFAGATLLPYTAFLKAAEQAHYDLDRLSDRFGTGFETTAQRLCTMQRPGASGVPLFMLRTDRAGNISKRHSATAFHFSHQGGSCPLWVLHRAFDRPDTIFRQVATMPDGRSYLWIARAVSHANGGFGSIPTEYAIGLGCDLADAGRLVYSRGMDLEPSRAIPIGPGCATCPRTDCMQRAFPPAGATIVISEAESPTVPYRHVRGATTSTDAESRAVDITGRDEFLFD